MRFLLSLLLMPMFVWAHEFEFQQEVDTIPVEIEGWELFAPWAGGFTESTPDLCDIDVDGDLDFFIGEDFGHVVFAQNIGTTQIAQFSWIASQYDSLYSINSAGNSHPDFADMDNDGDLDCIISAGYATYVENLGTAQVPNFISIPETLYTTGGYIIGPRIAIKDIDVDGDFDLISGYGGVLLLYRNIGTSDSFSFFYEEYGWLGITVDDWADPTFCDIDADGDDDLFIGCEAGTIWYYLNDGDSLNYDFVYQTNCYANIDVGDQASPEFADIDGDGDYDLFVGSEYTGPFFYENIGNPQNPIFQFVTEYYLVLDQSDTKPTPQLIDINGDGKLEFFSTTYDQMCYFENVGTQQAPSLLFVEEGWQYISHPSLKPFFVDINADGLYDLICGEGIIPGSPSVALYINRGTPQEPQLVLHDPNYITNSSFHANTTPGLTDIDDDNDYDMFISDDMGHFFYYQNIGDSLTPNFTYIDSQWQGIYFPYPQEGHKGFTFGDLDEDGDFDMLLSSPVQNNIYFYRNLGTPQVPAMYLETEEFLDYAVDFIYRPTLVDVDSDTDLDLFIGDGSGGIFFFRNITGQNEVGPKRPDIPFPRLDFSIGPNPANPVTWISFTLPSPQEATLAVYNILGAKVTTLTSGIQPPGTHSFIWNAAEYSSGVYIIRLETAQQTSSEKITVLK
ncbi:hypothetical protein CEE37_06790 [candidate division LCP-89 bacterium B3_LCP]|uniref:Secretion system C-terminal sorting domain-containing protein n=1 Tax=candidate division LCP-89 bacterium B3_LCP TaxID=2012998 RepID=A0A532V0C2_UNCL8|nr:MAG: hypothetical protein CEE37_06790 [candidate division LCP-89 bacterium B3_LCP]